MGLFTPIRTDRIGYRSRSQLLNSCNYSRSRARSAIIANPLKLLFWNVSEKPDTHPKTLLRKGFLRSFLRWLVIGVVLAWSLAALLLLAARWIDPPTTAVHIAAPLAGLDSPHAVSRTLQIHSPQPNLARSPARCHRRGGRAFLPAPWVRLAPDPNRCRRRSGRRSHCAELPPLRSNS